MIKRLSKTQKAILDELYRTHYSNGNGYPIGYFINVFIENGLVDKKVEIKKIQDSLGNVRYKLPVEEREKQWNRIYSILYNMKKKGIIKTTKKREKSLNATVIYYKLTDKAYKDYFRYKERKQAINLLKKYSKNYMNTTLALWDFYINKQSDSLRDAMNSINIRNKESIINDLIHNRVISVKNGEYSFIKDDFLVQMQTLKEDIKKYNL